ncbi:hypothetical protein K438DRAFT_1839060 [Mycena galopus ATCC 62051]|nr:hypothetical protein K438DRAFT_1839060 [Mycena galopus ATCC 62051]
MASANGSPESARKTSTYSTCSDCDVIFHMCGYGPAVDLTVDKVNIELVSRLVLFRS